MLRRLSLLALSGWLAVGSRAFAQDSPGVSLGALLDLRLASSSTETSFLDGGLGKVRYGGERGDRRYGIHVAQASIVLDARASDVLSAHVQANVDPESYSRSGLNGIDLVEAFALYRPALSRTLNLRLKAGHFFPPISLENDGYAWSVTRTITPSAIDGWVGEEVGVSGLEASLVFLLSTSDLTFTGALFGGNDPDGALLAWRGWSLSDRQTGLTDRLPLAPLSEIGPAGTFPSQAAYTAPFREVDGRAGWYAGASWRHAEGSELRALYFDNGGDRTSVERGQYSWETRFAAAGVRLPLGSAEFLAQGLDGRTCMGPGPLIQMKFRAAYALASMRAGAWRFSARGDLFRNTDERAEAYGEDEYGEHGWALTGAISLAATKQLRLSLELLHVDSSRPIRRDIGRPERAVENVVQASLRVRL